MPNRTINGVNSNLAVLTMMSKLILARTGTRAVRLTLCAESCAQPLPTSSDHANELQPPGVEY